ncbi:MAG: outer membrane lipoprotein chaperone LolA [Deltaproteobacteria bacterium]|nr:outer membrane lipoprotein chaperone LolA [Deltaproteobacteria bacterium]
MRLFLLSLGLLIATPLFAKETTTPEQALGRMQAFYAATRDLKGKFKQVYIDTIYNRRRTSYGYLYVKKPGMMRWNYVSPEPKQFIADGKRLWVYEPQDNQAFKNPLTTANLSTGLTFLLGSGNLKREFQAEFVSDPADKLGNAGDLLLKLTPREPTAQYRYLLFAVDANDFSVRESMVVSRHSRNLLVFDKLVRNSKLSKKRFAFAPPAGTRVIDGAKPR